MRSRRDKLDQQTELGQIEADERREQQRRQGHGRARAAGPGRALLPSRSLLPPAVRAIHSRRRATRSVHVPAVPRARSAGREADRARGVGLRHIRLVLDDYLRELRRRSPVSTYDQLTGVRRSRLARAARRARRETPARRGVPARRQGRHHRPHRRSAEWLSGGPKRTSGSRPGTPGPTVLDIDDPENIPDAGQRRRPQRAPQVRDRPRRTRLLRGHQPGDREPRVRRVGEAAACYVLAPPSHPPAPAPSTCGWRSHAEELPTVPPVTCTASLAAAGDMPQVDIAIAPGASGMHERPSISPT